MSTEEQNTDDSGKSNRLSDEDFAEACRLYEADEAGIVELAKRFGVTRQALSQRFKNNGIVRGSKAPRSASDEPRPETYSEKRGVWIEETRMQGYGALRSASMLARKIVADAARNKSPMSTVEDDLKAVQRYNKILCDNIRASLDLLQADDYLDEDELGILEISDLTDEDILQHHKDTGAVPEDATIEDVLGDLGSLEDIK